MKIPCDCVIEIDSEGNWHHALDCQREAERKKSEAFQAEQMKKLDELAQKLRKKEQEQIDRYEAGYRDGWRASVAAHGVTCECKPWDHPNFRWSAR